MDLVINMMDRKGQALLLDAFIFLIVVAVVSSALIGLSTSDQNGERMRGYVDQAHEVFLSTTVPNPAGNSSKNVTAAELLSLQLLQLFQEGNASSTTDWSSVNHDLSNVLRALLPNHYQFKWTARCGFATIELGQREGVMGEINRNVLASSLSSYLPSLERDMVMTLTVWPSASHMTPSLLSDKALSMATSVVLVRSM